MAASKRKPEQNSSCSLSSRFIFGGLSTTMAQDFFRCFIELRSAVQAHFLPSKDQNMLWRCDNDLLKAFSHQVCSAAIFLDRSCDTAMFVVRMLIIDALLKRLHSASLAPQGRMLVCDAYDRLITFVLTNFGETNASWFVDTHRAYLKQDKVDRSSEEPAAAARKRNARTDPNLEAVPA